VVKGLFSRLAFTGFGPLGLFPQAAPPLFAVQGRRPGRLRALVRREVPRLPGVYGMVNGGGELIYVGKAKCLRTRLLSYFRRRGRDPKAGQIVKDARVVVWEPGPSEFAALLRELELIRRWRPCRNVQGQPDRRRRGYVCVGRRPAPYVFFAGRPPATALARFGPVPAGEKAREAVRRVNDWFRLRDCPQAVEMVFADEQELFPLARAPGCLRHEIGNCLGPCAAACTRADYAGYYRAAVAFLRGEDDSPLGMLEREMLAAAAATQFERAAALRDRLDSLRWLSDHLAFVRQAAQHSFVYPVAGHDGAETWYLIHRGRVQGAVPAPADDAGRVTAASALEAVYRQRAEMPGPPGFDEIDGVLLVAGWFRRHPEERERTLAPDEALAACAG
jgi:excinuclease ABC subunit C